MWTTRKITLLNSPLPAAQRIITCAALAEHAAAQSLLATARQEAESCLAAAHEQAENILEEARARSAAESARHLADAQQAFITRTETLFADWHSAQQAWQDHLLPLAESLLVQAMTQLLGAQPDTARCQAVLRQLLKVQGRQSAATLLCSPAQHAAVADWLAQHADLPWSLTTDAALDPDALVLTTDNGELHLSWTQLCAALMPV